MGCVEKEGNLRVRAHVCTCWWLLKASLHTQRSKYTLSGRPPAFNCCGTLDRTRQREAGTGHPKERAAHNLSIPLIICHTTFVAHFVSRTHTLTRR